MGAKRFVIDSSKSKVVVSARSSIHDTTTTWSNVSGHIEIDPDNPSAGGDATVEVAMDQFDAGDWLKNRKLRKDLAVDRFRKATFRLTGLEDIVSSGAKHEAHARGTLSWRDRSVELVASGDASLAPDAIRAVARFELDVRKVGVTPPKILMLKVEDVVGVEVTLVATLA